jgi:hypothetical protein
MAQLIMQGPDSSLSPLLPEHIALAAPAQDAAAATTPLLQRQPNGLSLQEALDIVADGQHLPMLPLAWPPAWALDPQHLNSLGQLSDLLASQSEQIGSLGSTDVLQLVQRTHWSERWQQQFVRASQQLQQIAEQTAAHAEQLRQLMNLPPLVLNRKGRIALAVLVRCLPQARGHDWRFMLRPGAAEVCQRLRRALTLLDEQRRLASQLAPAWSDTTLHRLRNAMERLQQLRGGLAELPAPWPAEIYSALVHGIGLLSTHVETAQQLSASYAPEISQLDVDQLLRRWEHADRKVWPANWMGRRKVLALLRSTIRSPHSTHRPDIGADLRRLVRLRQLAAELAQLQPLANHAELPWSDLQTPLDEARAALTVQTALRQLNGGSNWQIHGLQAVAATEAGSPVADTARRLCELHARQQELDQQSAGLDVATGGLWQGRQTDLARLEAAIAYQHALRAQLTGRDWAMNEPLEAVANGVCGAELAAGLAHLRGMQRLQGELTRLETALREQTDGLWLGAESDSEEVDRAIKCHGSLSAAISALAVSAQTDAAIRAAVGQLMAPGCVLLSPSGAFGDTGRGYLNKLAVLPAALDHWAAHTDASPTLRTALHEASLDLLMTQAHELLDAAPHLPHWCEWQHLQAEACRHGLAPLLDALHAGLVPAGQLRALFEVNYCRWWLQSMAQGTESCDAAALDAVFDATIYDDGLHELPPAPAAPTGSTRPRRGPVFHLRQRRSGPAGSGSKQLS